MAQEIKIAGATYSGVPAVDFVDASGGGHRFVDASPTTAEASDVASGKVFVDAAGNVVTGSAMIGGVMAHYGSCSTAAGTAAKTVDCTGFTLVTGALVFVKFTVTNTAANPTLNVNGTGAKALQYRGDAISAGYLAANRTYAFVYDGTNYQLVGDLDTNTTYSAMTAATESAAGRTGLVPAPAAGEQVSFLRGDGRWVVPTNTDTHWTTHMYAGSGAAANAATTNGNTKLVVTDNSTIRNTVTIKGSGAATVTSDANGVITINSTDNNTVYTHPTTSGNKHIPDGGSSGQILRWSAAGTAAWGADNNTTYSSGTAGNLTTGTDTTAKVWTPKILADYVKGTVSLATNGYYKDRNGLIIQWGTGTSNTVKTFPIAFSAVYSIVITCTTGDWGYVTDLSTTSFKFRGEGNGRWIAIGK